MRTVLRVLGFCVILTACLWRTVIELGQPSDDPVANCPNAMAWATERQDARIAHRPAPTYPEACDE